MSVVTSDMFTDRGLALPDLESSTSRRLKDLLADTTPGNPFDSGGQFLSSGVELLVEALNTFAEDPNLNFIVYCLMPVAGLRTKVYAEGIVRAAQTSEKPSMVLHYRAGEITKEASRILGEAGLLVFDPPEAAIDALQLWLASAIDTNATNLSDEPVRIDDLRAGKARAIVNEWRRRSFVTVSQGASQSLLDLYAIPHSRQTLVSTIEEAIAVVSDYGTPVAMKVESVDLPHRSDFGGVILDVVGPESAREAFETLAQRTFATNPQARVDGVLIDEMAKAGTELVAGISVDQTLGPAVVVGMGGVMAEIFNDVSIRLPPIDDLLAEEMLRELKGSAVLFGHRGTSGIDIPAVRSLLVRLGEISIDLDRSVNAVDLNPVVVYPPGQGLEVLDVLVEMA
jgi:acetyltransferase